MGCPSNCVCDSVCDCVGFKHWCVEQDKHLLQLVNKDLSHLPLFRYLREKQDVCKVDSVGDLRFYKSMLDEPDKHIQIADWAAEEVAAAVAEPYTKERRRGIKQEMFELAVKDHVKKLKLAETLLKVLTGIAVKLPTKVLDLPPIAKGGRLCKKRPAAAEIGSPMQVDSARTTRKAGGQPGKRQKQKSEREAKAETRYTTKNTGAAAAKAAQGKTHALRGQATKPAPPPPDVAAQIADALAKQQAALSVAAEAHKSVSQVGSSNTSHSQVRPVLPVACAVLPEIPVAC